MTRIFESADALAGELLATIGKKLVVGVPIGIGKAIHVVDALFERAAADASISLTIFTGLTLEKPAGKNDLERRFLGPLVERLYADWPDPDYAVAVRRNRLPANIEVREFYLQPGAYLANPLAQMNYTSINYSHVTTELLDLGVNVIAQLVSSRAQSPGRYSLGSNPEITLDLLPRLEERRRKGQAIAMVGQVNGNLPYMTGDAEIDADRFDFVLDSQDCGFPLFALPNRQVSAADYATGMHVASLVPDGGTLQIGIGSLSDAIAHCLKLRHTSPEIFLRVLELLPGGPRSSRRSSLPVEHGPFERGLFASTELMSDALFALFAAGIIKRPADVDDPAVIHAGFFIGSSKLYEQLRALDEAQQRQIRMTRISEVNTLFGDEAGKRRQRQHARFVNETMMITLLGAAVSDGLEDGRVVSGVGGQFDFVSMAYALDDAQSILACRARRLYKGVATSNIRWSYGHTTVPRHYRDIFVSEYGIAATKGRSDRQVIDAIVQIADAEFQPELIDAAKNARKLEQGYALSAYGDNTPERVLEVFERDDVSPHFPPYPLGTELTPTEQELVAALQWLEARTARPWTKAALLAEAIARPAKGYAAAMARMGLEKPTRMRERLLRRLVGIALERTQA